ncbi:MAG: KpsF/GutQ family sugar-phosphate isomerase [Bacteroidales bacterium]|nr:KpsF/GutQ family sugar-phosphate isomerase [Bacteroidales bacterium]
MSLITDIGIKCLRDEANALLGIIPSVGEEFEKAVDIILNCKGKFIVTGVGKSGHVGEKIAATMASLGTPSFFVNPLDAFHGDLGMLDSRDVVLAISYSGNTDELLRLIPFLIDRNIPIISMTGNTDSLLAQYSSCNLNVAVEREADPLNLAPTSSTTAQMAMGDALAIALSKVRNFKETDFARFHPGGTLGKRLLARVKDYMITTNLPVVHLSNKVSDTIIEISKNKMGIAVVLESEKIIGVVTDGDVRRAMQYKQDEFFQLSVRDIMSTSPKIINQMAKLSQASDLMRKHNIHSLIVENDSHEFVGIIDSFTCS